MSSIQLSSLRHDITLLTMDMPGKSANVLTDDFYEDLDNALKTLEANPPSGLVLYSAKPNIYVAGADLVKIQNSLDWPEQQIIEFCNHGRGIMRRISLLPTVSVAAIHGICVGGGLELTLWCDHRIVSDDRRSLLGLPEVKLGLVPGWAGTVRLPRLIGLAAAVDLVTSARLVSPEMSLQMGLASEIVDQDKLLDSAVKWIDHERRDSKLLIAKREKLESEVTQLPSDLNRFRQQQVELIRANQEIDSSAPLIILQHMIRTAALPACEGYVSEAIAFSKVWGSDENRGLLHNFFLEERAKKVRARFDEGQPPRTRTVGVIGSGLIGSQIIRLALKGGFAVKVFDADQAKQTALVRKLTANEQVNSSNLISVSGLEGLAECDLLIESIVEKLSIKRQLFQRLVPLIGPDTLLATNTSTIPVSDIADVVRDPGRLVGIHFCCPVEPLKLVEIIQAENTSDHTLNAAIDFVRRIRKTPVVVADSPGFVVNRLLCPVFNQSVAMLQRGLTPDEIDTPMREFGFIAGPLQMIDFIGVDTIMYAGETFLRTLPELVSLTPILPALVKRGRLGRKSGAGFYRYDSFEGPARPDEALLQIISQYQLDERRPSSDQELLRKFLDPMVAEARKLVDQQVVADARDVDLCSILGTTFPAVKGGILFWADNFAEH